MTKTRISWTQREYKELAAWFLDHQYSPEEHGMRPRLKEAQVAVLPRDRHRPMSWVDAGTRRKLTEYWKELRAVPDIPTLARESEPEPPKVPTLDDFTLEDLLVEIARRVARGFESITQAPQIVSATTLVDVAHKHNPFMHSAPRVPRPELLVVGTYGPQEACLRDLFGNAELVFVGSDASPGMISRHGAGADHAFILTKFISHAMFDHVKKLSCEYTMVNGGMTELKERMREYLRP